MARDLVFISYRRGDAGAQAGRLAAELKWRFGEQRVFFDTESISGGQAFPERIQEALGRARIVLVVMGLGWLKAVDEHSRRRIDDPKDWVHQEVVGALSSDGVTVIPVLVDDARMPPGEALPDALAELAVRSRMLLEHAQFTLHAEQIARRIRELGAEEQNPARSPFSPSTPFEPTPVAGFLSLPEPPQRATPPYQPYPAELVKELVELTRRRELGTPAEKSQRQARITQLANRLARNPAAGDEVAGVLLVQRLGKGNYGTVWLGSDAHTGEERAVKVFDTDRLGLGTSLYHFSRGLRAMQHLAERDGRPRTIVQLHEAEPSGLAFSMDYLEGGDLTHVAERGWALKKKLELVMSVCQAVEFAHANDVIHRDIKPANIVMRGADPVLTDFDIADLVFAKTQSTQASGTVNYSAPEALAGQGSGPTVDVFSLGRLLHFLLLEADPPLTFEDVPKLDDIAAEHPVLARIIRKCTLRNPTERYPTVEALRIDLERHVHGNDERVGIEPSLGPVARTAAPRPAVLTAASVTAGGAILAAVIAGGVALYNGQRPSVAAGPATASATTTEGSQPPERALPNPERVHEKTGIEFVPIARGTFLMGSPPGLGRNDEGPQHQVTVSAFELGKYPVTNAQYRRFLQAHPRAKEPEYWAERRYNQAWQPVVGVSWEDAQTYARWAGLRLPTEAEREHATRAGKETQYWSGDTEADLARVGWFSGNSDGYLHDVGEKEPNAFGLHDLHGNVWEWCSDWYGRYAAKAATDPTGPEMGDDRVIRGGSWRGDALIARSAHRGRNHPAHRNDDLGFRLARGPRTSK